MSYAVEHHKEELKRAVALWVAGTHAMRPQYRLIRFKDWEIPVIATPESQSYTFGLPGYYSLEFDLKITLPHKELMGLYTHLYTQLRESGVHIDRHMNMHMHPTACTDFLPRVRILGREFYLIGVSSMELRNEDELSPCTFVVSVVYPFKVPEDVNKKNNMYIPLEYED